MRCSIGHNCNRRAMHCRPLLHKLNSTMHLISGTLHSIPFPWLPVLSNIELPALWRKAATDKLVEKIIKYDSWPIQPDILNPPFLHWHPGHHCSWTCNQLTSKVDGGITESQQPGFDLPRHQWSLRSCFRTEQGHCGACRRKWRLADTDLSLQWDSDDAPNWRILSPDKTEWRLIPAALCRWRRCFLADQLWFMTRIREEEEDWIIGILHWWFSDKVILAKHRLRSQSLVMHAR